MTARREYVGIAALLLGAAVSALGLWYALGRLELRAAWDTIRAMRTTWLAWTVLPLAAGTLLRALRWNVLVARRGLGPSLAAIFVSSFFNGVLPFRAGEAMRALFFARRTRTPLTVAATAAVVERVLDVTTLALLGLLLLSAQLRSLILVYFHRSAAITLGAAIGVGAILVLFRLQRNIGGAFGSVLNQVRHTIAFLSSPGRAAALVVLSVAMWLITSVPFVLVLRAAHATASLEDGLVILLIVTLAIALPSTPGFVGTFHAGFVLGAESVGIPGAVSVPAAVVTHLLLQLPFILAGAIVLATGGRALLQTDFQVDDSSRRS